jgi:hypothetical protein
MKRFIFPLLLLWLIVGFGPCALAGSSVCTAF